VTPRETSPENPYAGQGPVLLDIGGDVGALVVSMPARLDGVEVEIRPADDQGALERGDERDDHRHHPHVAVVARPTGDGILHSLVFGSVRAGRYRLHSLPGGPCELEVDVVGAAVTEAVWPATGLPSTA